MARKAEPLSIDAELAFLEELGKSVTPVLPDDELPNTSSNSKPVDVKPSDPEVDEDLAFLCELAGTTPEAELKAKELRDLDAAAAAKLKNDDPVASTSNTTTEPAVKEEAVKEEAMNEEAMNEEPEKEQVKAEEETYERDATELLGAFKTEKVESEAEALSAAEVMKMFMMEMRAADRDNEVHRILWAFKLNPFEKMNLRFTATESDVRKQYRKISLLIHPDKCTHPQAPDAFEILGNAQKELLQEQIRENLMRVLEFARDQVREERRKATKHDSALRLAASLHPKGREGVEEDWEGTDDFHDKWKLKSRDVLAKSEFRRRKLNIRLKEEEVRIVAGEKEDAQARKKARTDKKQWLDKRGDRIESWRDWNVAKKSKKSGGIKAPKLKTADADKSYVQRNATEQFVGNYKKKAPK